MKRHTNHGLRKYCPCQRRVWAKCEHSWHFSFKHAGQAHRFSLDKHLGRRINSKTEAETEAEKLRVAIREGRFDNLPSTPAALPQGETLAAFAQSWLQTASLNLKASTIKFYRDNLDKRILPLLGTRGVETINRADCRNLITALRQGGLKTSSVGGAVRTLSTVLSQAVEDGLLPANPALRPGKYLRNADEPKHEPSPLTRSEADKLLAVAEEEFPEWYPWLLCALRTGMRIGELLALQWGDITWTGPNPNVLVQRSLVKGTLTTPKNHHKRRVDLSRRLRGVLRLSRLRRSREARADGCAAPAWVFSSRVGTPLDVSNIRKVYRRILAKAELPARRIHDLRHTFASLLIQQGEPIVYVQKQMGHKSIQITVDVYGKWEPGGNRGAVDRLDAA